MTGYNFLRAFHDFNDEPEDCCVFTAELFNLVCVALPDESRIIQRGTELWRRAMITDPLDAWSVLLAYSGKIYGMEPSVILDPLTTDGSAYLVQGWGGLEDDKVVKGAHGHTWLWLPVDGELGLRLHNSRQHGKRIEVGEWTDIAGRYEEIGIVEL